MSQPVVRMTYRIETSGDVAALAAKIASDQSTGTFVPTPGETAELKNLTDYSRRYHIGLIAMTASADSTLGKAADVVLALPQASEACPHNLAPTTSALMQLALGDALAIALLESRGFTAVDFGVLHPGGRLGALLKFARKRGYAFHG